MQEILIPTGQPFDILINDGNGKNYFIPIGPNGDIRIERYDSCVRDEYDFGDIKVDKVNVTCVPVKNYLIEQREKGDEGP